MFTAGIVSVTFRGHSPQTVADLASQAGLCAVEWGGDIHVPPTDVQNAASVGQLTRAAGLQVISYGSYFRAGYTAQTDFQAEIAAARALGAPNIRIWAGKKGSADETDRRAVARSIRMCADACEKEGMTLSLELHGGTLTDNPESALQLIDETAHRNLHLYWQPNQYRDLSYNTDCLHRLLPHITNVHVFSWSGKEKFPLVHGENAWRQYIDILAGSGRDHGMLMEFVCDGSDGQFLEDAAVLLQWLK